MNIFTRYINNNILNNENTDVNKHLLIMTSHGFFTGVPGNHKISQELAGAPVY